MLPVLSVIFLQDSFAGFAINQVIVYLAGAIDIACRKVFLMNLLFLLGELMMFQQPAMIYSKVA